MSDAPPDPRASAASEETPPVVPDHTLIRRIGAGSYGDVWLARNIMGTFRAVKIVYRSRFENERPFDREFRGIKKFEPISRGHEGLIDLLQVGRNEELNCFYYVMELADDEVTGQNINPDTYVPKTLRSVLQERRRLPHEESVALAVVLTESLAFLHGKGLVHRDIKPSNIIFIHGQPKLADIGLVTEPGEVSFVGTTGFMPPEGPGTKQADVYSLGKVLYEISTGKDRGHFPEPATLIGSEADSGVARELNEIVLRACENDPRRRYQSAEKMREDLLLLQSGKSIRRIRKLERRLAVATKFGIAAGVMALLAVAAFLYQKERTEQERRLRAAEATQREKDDLARRLTGTHVQRALDYIDRDQRVKALPHLAYVLRHDPKNELAARELMFALSQQRYARLAIPPLVHADQVICAQFSPAGDRIVSAAADGNAWLWDSGTGTRLAGPFNHGAEINTTCFSPDGKRIVTAGKDGTAKIWQADASEQPLHIFQHKAAILSAKFSRDGRWIATASDDATARVWNAADGQAVSPPLTHDTRLMMAAFSPSADRVVTASRDQTARIWITSNGSNVVVIRHPGVVRNACFSRDGKRVLTSSDGDNTARVWDAVTGRPLTQPMIHGERIESAEFSPGESLIVTASGDFTARLWDASTGTPVKHALRHDDVVRSARFSRDGKRVITASWDRAVRMWDVDSGELLVEPFGFHIENFRTAEFHPDGRRILTTSRGKHVLLWDIAALPFTELLLQHDNRVSSAAFDDSSSFIVTTEHMLAGPSAVIWNRRSGQPQHWLCESFSFSNGAECRDNTVLVAADNGTATTWDLTTGKLKVRFQHSKEVSTAHFSPDGKCIVTASWDRTARVWKSETGAAITPPLQHESAVLSAEFSPDGIRVFTVCADKKVRVWNAATGSQELPALEHESSIVVAKFAPDNKCIVTGSSDGGLHFWNARDGKPIAKALAHKKAIMSLQFSSDGQRIITASEDNTAQIWDAITKLPVGEPLRHRDSVTYAEFSSDGQYAVTSSKDNTSALWDVETGRAVGRKLESLEYVYSARFSRDGRFIVTASRDYTARVFELPFVAPPLPQWMLSLAEILAGERITTTGAREPVGPETMRTLRSAVVTDGMDEYSKWARWFFAAPASQTLSPSLVITRSNYLQLLFQAPIAFRGRSSYVKAVALEPSDGRILAKLSAVCLASADDPATANFIEADTWLNRALELSPRSPETWWTLMGVMQSRRRRGLPAFLDEFQVRVPQHTNDPMFWFARALLAETQTNISDAVSHYTTCFRMTRPTPPRWDFAHGDSLADWKPSNIAKIEVEGEVLKLSIAHEDSQLAWPVAIDGSMHKQLQLRMKNGTAAEWAELFWSQGDRKFIAGSEMHFRINPFDSNLTTYTIDLSHNSQWTHQLISTLRLDIGWYSGSITGDVEIAWIALDGGSATKPVDPETKPVYTFIGDQAFAARQRLIQKSSLPSEPLFVTAATNIPPRSPAASPRVIDLTSFYNVSLMDSWWGPSLPKNNLAALETGVQKLMGIQFDIRGVVQLDAPQTALFGVRFTQKCEGIPVRQHCQRLHFLHSTAWSATTRKEIGHFVIHYEDGSKTERPIFCGEDVQDWWKSPERHDAPGNPTVIWTGQNEETKKRGASLRLFLTTWTNPVSDRLVETIDYVSTMTECAPFLIAITAE